MSDYYDKVLGGWVGKSAGGILGAPIEGYKRFNRIELTDELFANTFANDDLDLQILWLDMVSKKGPWVREADFRRHWHDHVSFPWNEYGIASRNIAIGLDIPDTGRHNNYYWSESMGSPIRSEIWGMLFPGQPERAAHYARIDSELDHTGFSVHAEMYLSACAALAFESDDLAEIMREARRVLPSGSDCLALLDRVGEWYARHGFATTAAKVKSYYGDADFTAAPMNVGFTVLSLLHAGKDFDRVVESLRLGHDSDCVVATAAALLGIMKGNDAIPELWRERVGNDLVISPEVTGIRTPSTLTELAEWTCEVGRRIEAGWPAPACPFAVRCAMNGTDGLALHFENFRAAPLSLSYTLSSAHFAERRGQLELSAGESSEATVDLAAIQPTGQASLPYRIDVVAEGQVYDFERGLPNYGRWLLLGPFVQDDPSLEPMDAKYPDHGLSSMPSVRYMNHDAVNTAKKAFVSHEEVEQMLRKAGTRDARPYRVSSIAPASMTVDLGRHFAGRGERTLYLSTILTCGRSRKCWLCLGSTAHLSAWVNGAEVLSHRGPRRRWPGTAVAEIELMEGDNIVTLRIDTIVDDYLIDVGFKDHLGRHHHQSAWSTDLVPTIGA